MSDDKRPGSGATHFGFDTVEEQQKAQKVAGVFDSVATRYDLMNDLMSAGMHRLWKAFTVRQADVRPGMRALDIAGGTGDLARAFADRAGDTGLVVLSDINESMLRAGRDKLLDKGRMLPLVQCDAERLPFADDSFDVVSVAFGLRNMTHKDVALAEMRRVTRPGGKVLVLEFSRVWAPLAPLYDAYSFSVLPWLGS
jgi:demethylmenaquinone methyltransferase/2-methoxy-6-polyprenyl-1,4-benzoquinol methylase